MRLPNPWVAIPVGLAALGGSTVGFFVTSASCAPERCLVPAVAVAVAVGLVAATGVGVVVVLAFRSLAEFRVARERDVLTFVDHPASEAPADVIDPETPVITEADQSHVEAISEFLWAAWTEAGAGATGWVGATDEAIAEMADPEAIRARLGGPGRRMFLAMRPEGVVGLAGTRRLDAETAELAGIVVLQSVVGSGVGTPLLELAVSALAAEGVRRVVVTTEAANERARRFYEHRGFTEHAAHTEDVGGVRIEVVAMERTLGRGD